jgi:thiol-disulfide isomerase/thioredoxin
MPAEQPPPRPDRGTVPSPGRRYSTLVGIAFLALIVVVTVNTIGTQGPGTLGVSKSESGMPLPEFAVPNARTGPLDKDANIFQDDCSTSENPCPSDARRTPACDIQAPGAIRVCDLFDRPLVLSFWFTKGANCLPTQDVIDRVAAGYRGRVNFLSIDVRDDPSAVHDIVAARGWKIPVGYDRDGAVSNLYRVGVCPTVAFAYPGGILAFAKIGELSVPILAKDIQRLLRRSRERASEAR